MSIDGEASYSVASSCSGSAPRTRPSECYKQRGNCWQQSEDPLAHICTWQSDWLSSSLRLWSMLIKPVSSLPGRTINDHLCAINKSNATQQSRFQRPQKKMSKPSTLNASDQTQIVEQPSRNSGASENTYIPGVMTIRQSDPIKAPWLTKLLFSTNRRLLRIRAPCVHRGWPNRKYPLIFLPCCQIPVWRWLKGQFQKPYCNLSRSSQLPFPLPPLEWESPSSLNEALRLQDSCYTNLWLWSMRSQQRCSKSPSTVLTGDASTSSKRKGQDKHECTLIITFVGTQEKKTHFRGHLHRLRDDRLIKCSLRSPKALTESICMHWYWCSHGPLLLHCGNLTLKQLEYMALDCAR